MYVGSICVVIDLYVVSRGTDSKIVSRGKISPLVRNRNESIELNNIYTEILKWHQLFFQHNFSPDLINTIQNKFIIPTMYRFFIPPRLRNYENFCWLLKIAGDNLGAQDNGITGNNDAAGN